MRLSFPARLLPGQRLSNAVLAICTTQRNNRVQNWMLQLWRTNLLTGSATLPNFWLKSGQQISSFNSPLSICWQHIQHRLQSQHENYSWPQIYLRVIGHYFYKNVNRILRNLRQINRVSTEQILARSEQGRPWCKTAMIVVILLSYSATNLTTYKFITFYYSRVINVVITDQWEKLWSSFPPDC